MNPLRNSLCACIVGCAAFLNSFSARADTTYVVRQEFTVKELPAGAKEVEVANEGAVRTIR